MRCACGRPRRLSGRSVLCAACHYAQRVARAVETRIDRTFKREQHRQRAERRWVQAFCEEAL
jgi:hypothetical protein